jgi:hypothetical protein
MKTLKILFTLIFTLVVADMQAQYVAIFKTNGSVKQYSMEEVDSIVFFEKEQNFDPTNPSDQHGSDNYTDVAVTGGVNNTTYSTASITCYVNVPNEGETYVVGIRYSTEEIITEDNSTTSKQVVTNATKGNHTYSFELNNLENDKKYYYQAFVELYSNEKYYYGETLSFAPKTINLTIGEAIDMGVSVKWASTNLGAEQPEEDGNYYAYGELEPKETYDYDNYKYADIESLGDNISGNKYFDAAAAKLGGKWRMPTYSEFLELKSNTKTEKVKYKGKDGYIIESTVNGNSIFMPYNGVKSGSKTNDYYSLGSYWTATYGIYSNTSDGNWNHWEISYYGFGHPFLLSNSQGLGIRPVSD